MITIILSNERSASIMFLFASFLYLIFNNFFSIKEKIIKIFLLSLVVIGLFNFNPQLKEHFIKRTFEQIGITKNNQKMHESFWDYSVGSSLP